LLTPLFNFLFLLAGAGGGNDNKVIFIVNDSNKEDDDGDEGDNDDEEDNNDNDGVSLSSVLFSKMEFHTNGFVILQNDFFLFQVHSHVGGL
jgi:hypothetical protein